ncbi:hypothetical protein [Thiorhodovibrio frisius]|uniref:Uncharacterized protein n=1 Tax=Thiorhodovibrio frisius TaxID=631362 RepID=H8YYY0_9GAMM|nr:hypothetical protein [Thiorhodovibrio frisius]EIC23656.1 hypothetical protein Thi970DRAFT_01339 [Thiorhodovibrio frisius]WPL23252.1 hypothetical protein Thiofri_03437 [Thiorhodovibrio frisius]
MATAITTKNLAISGPGTYVVLLSAHGSGTVVIGRLGALILVAGVTFVGGARNSRIRLEPSHPRPCIPMQDSA